MPMEGFGEVAEKLRRSTVFVSAGRRGLGSGVIVRSDGIVVTNAHVAAFAPIHIGLWDGTRTEASILRRDVGCDLAVLRLSKSGLPSARLANSDRVRVGQLVVAIGNPLGFMGALTTGIVHSIGRVPGLGPMKWIQSDVRLAPGNSGGPLGDEQGCVIGLNTMIAQGVGLAVPSNTVSRFLGARRSKARLGVVARSVEIARNGSDSFGVMILEVLKDGAAAMASLMPGDILVGLDGQRLQSADDFERALEEIREGVMRIQFLRGDPMTVRTVAVRLRSANTAAA
jgi:serine protease Do